MEARKPAAQTNIDSHKSVENVSHAALEPRNVLDMVVLVPASEPKYQKAFN